MGSGYSIIDLAGLEVDYYARRDHQARRTQPLLLV